MPKVVKNQFNKIGIWFAVILTIIFLYCLSPVLMPFLLAFILAYILNPLVRYLISYKLSRLTSVIIIFVIFLFIVSLVVMILIPLIEAQITDLFIFIPKLLAWAQTKFLPGVAVYFHIDSSNGTEAIKKILSENISKAGSAAAWFVQTIFQSGKSIFEGLLNLILIPVVLFYLLRDWPFIWRKLDQIIPKNIEPTVVKLTKECDLVLSEFLRGQLLVMLALGVFYAVALTAMGLQIGLIIGIIVGLISIVPYLGTIIGVLLATGAAIIQFNSLTYVALTLIIFIIGNCLENFLLIPKLVGNRIGLHPVASIFAILVGGSLFGFFGILLAMPVAAVIMVLLKHGLKKYHQSDLYQV